MTATSERLAQIRRASRQLVRELGFMQPTLAGSGLPASAVHALIEIDLAGPLTAAQLATLLNLEKSSVSRMLGQADRRRRNCRASQPRRSPNQIAYPERTWPEKRRRHPCLW